MAICIGSCLIYFYDEMHYKCALVAGRNFSNSMHLSQTKLYLLTNYDSLIFFRHRFAIFIDAYLIALENPLDNFKACMQTLRTM